MSYSTGRGDAIELLSKQTGDANERQTMGFNTAIEAEHQNPSEQTGAGNIRLRDKPAPHRSPVLLLFRSPSELLYATLVALQAIPVVLLVLYAPKLSKMLSRSGCLPSGEFRIPGDASIWDADLFFTPTILTTAKSGLFTKKPSDVSSGMDYTSVKVIDLAWDVGVGRGGQTILAYIAYRVFHKSIDYLLETRIVRFGTYGAVAFDTGNFAALQQLIHAPWRFRCGALEWRAYTLMALATAYIVAMPTLFSAMTGYAAVSTPAVMVPNFHANKSYIQPGSDEPGKNADYCLSDGSICNTIQCVNGGFQPGFAWNADFVRFANVTWASVASKPGIAAYPDDETSHNTYLHGDDRAFTAYYRQWQDSYHAAISDADCSGNWSSPTCEPLQHSSVFPWHQNPGTINDDTEGHLTPAHSSYPFDPPLLNLQLWPVDDQGKPTVWLCNDLVINAKDFIGGRNVTGICTAGSAYQWGFSFLLLFTTCICNLVFALIMYSLWWEADRYAEAPGREYRKEGKLTGWVSAEKPSLASDAVRIVGEMEAQFGEQVRGWSSRELDVVVWRGSKGMKPRSR